MKWIDYVESNGDLESHLLSKYSNIEVGSIIRLFNSRKPLLLDAKFNLVSSIGNMVFGQFIMAERALTTMDNHYESLRELANSIIRPLEDSVFDNTDDGKELLLRAEIMDENAKDVLEECIRYSDIRNKFVKEDFAGVFYKSDNEEDEEDEDEDDIDDESFEAKFSRDWYWYTIVNSLASDDILKHEAIYMMKMRDIAPHLAYLRMKGIIDYKQRKAEEMASKLKR